MQRMRCKDLEHDPVFIESDPIEKQPVPKVRLPSEALGSVSASPGILEVSTFGGHC